MHKTKLIDCLTCLSNKEWKRLEQYLASPFFNRQDRSIQFLRYLSAYRDQLHDHPDLDKRTVFEHLFPGQSFDASKLRLEISHLFQLCKGFLAQLSLQENDIEADLMVLSQLRKRKKSRLFKTEYQAISRKLDKKSPNSTQTHFYAYRLAEEANLMYGQQYLRIYDPNLQEKVDQLDLYYLTIKLKESCEMLNRRNILNTPYRMEMVEELRSYLEKKPEQIWADPAIQIYYRIIRLLSEPEEEAHFHNLLLLLRQHYAHFPKAEARAMYKYAQNYCIRKQKSGRIPFRQALFDLYQESLNNGILLVDGKIAPTDYQNIALIGLHLRQTQWVGAFLEEFRKKILSPQGENVYHYCLAEWHYVAGESGKAIQLLNQIRFTDLSYQVNARTLLLRIYYEQEEMEATLYHLDAFAIFVKRNRKLSPDYKLSLLNQIKITRRLLKVRDRRARLRGEEFQHEVDLLHRQLQHTSQLANRHWLAEKLESLKA